MKYLQHLKCCLFASIVCVLAICISALFSCLAVPIASASSTQADFFTDSTSYLVVSPNQLNVNGCHTSNNQAWTCVVTLYGKNINNAIAWSASSPVASIAFNPSKGYLAKVASLVQVTISHIPCISTSLLFSGQAYGSGVIPATAMWSCTPKPTPAPTHQPVSTPTPQPSPTHKITTPTATPVATTIPRPTPTVTLPPTSIVSSNSQSDPPVKGNGNSSGGVFLVSAILVLGVLSCVAVILIAMLIKRKISKAR